MLNIKKHSIFSREEKGNCRNTRTGEAYWQCGAVLEAERQRWP